MSQSRTRKAPAPAEGARPRVSAKVPGDTTKTPQQQKSHHHHRSKTRIPKSIRYDLENALVGLCDVWFEDIKPHLLRNNIKVHIQGAEDAGAGAGDQTGRLPSGAPGCSHLDPGAASDHQQRGTVSFVDSCSTQPTASRARCRRPRVLPFKLLSPLPSPPAPLTPQAQYPSCENIVVAPPPRRRRRRRCRRVPPPAQPVAPVPRLCRTSSAPTRPNTHPVDYNGKSCRPKSVLEPHMPMCKRPTQRTIKRDKSTQTDCSLMGRQAADRDRSTDRRRSPSRNKRKSSSPNRQVPLVTRRSSASKQCMSPKQPPVSAIPSSHTQPSTPLFQDDLINIIGESHDKIIEMLYQGPRREDNASTMSFISSAKRPTSSSKIPPWR